MARRAIRLVLLLAALCAAIGTSAAADPVTLTPAELRKAAMLASQGGQHETALAMARALIARDPEDFTAHIIASRSYRDLGQADEALTEALTASKLAVSDAERFSSSLLVAQALSTAGRRTEAQLWLRWAAGQAPNEQARAVAQRDFRYVRSRNPVKLDFSFDVAPSNNINNGSSGDTMTYLGLPFSLSPDAQALSGVRYAAGVDLTWRFPATERRRAQAVLSFYHETHTMSAESKALAPSTDASEFDYTVLAAQYSQVLNFGPGKGLWTWDVAAGRAWFGRAPLSDFATLGLGRTLAWGEVGNITIAGELGYLGYIDGSGVSATTLDLSATLDRRLTSGGRLTFELGAKESTSDEFNLDYRAYRLNAAWRFAKPLAGARVTLSAGLELREFPFSLYTPIPGHREDLSRDVSAEFLFPNAQVWGFAPTVTAEYKLQDSNADRYDTETFSLQLGIRSVF